MKWLLICLVFKSDIHISAPSLVIDKVCSDSVRTYLTSSLLLQVLAENIWPALPLCPSFEFLFSFFLLSCLWRRTGVHVELVVSFRNKHVQMSRYVQQAVFKLRGIFKWRLGPYKHSKAPSLLFYWRNTRWFKYDRDWFSLIYTEISPGHIWITLYISLLCEVVIVFVNTWIKFQKFPTRRGCYDDCCLLGSDSL
jgi:hypothetical protein